MGQMFAKSRVFVRSETLCSSQLYRLLMCVASQRLPFCDSLKFVGSPLCGRADAEKRLISVICVAPEHADPFERALTVNSATRSGRI